MKNFLNNVGTGLFSAGFLVGAVAILFAIAGLITQEPAVKDLASEMITVAGYEILAGFIVGFVGYKIK